MKDLDIKMDSDSPTAHPDFINRAFEQVRGVKSIEKEHRGSLAEILLSRVIRPANSSLDSLGSDLRSWILRPVASFNRKERFDFEMVPLDLRGKIAAIRSQMQRDLGEVLVETSSQSLYGELPIGILDTPRYYPQQQARSCATADFRMIFEAITGHNLPEEELYTRAKESGLIKEEMGIPGEIIPSEDLLAIFNTAVFESHYPNHLVRTITCWGSNLTDIGEIVSNLKGKLKPGTKVFCLASIKSEITTDGFHGVVVLSADAINVYVHDPSNIVGGANRAIPKSEFMLRWGKSCFGSEIIIDIPLTPAPVSQ